ncbi:hypothetical protein SLS63_004288 [Diaporthe eres]|uniref:Uncharacterized protein n=1 Tax=Diaporthe eres TaxID=83184 RepID=A0ABR1PED6_DIAER
MGLIYEARQGLEAGIWDLQNALSAITDASIDSMVVLEGAIESRKSCLSEAAAEVTTAASTEQHQQHQHQQQQQEQQQEEEEGPGGEGEGEEGQGQGLAQSDFCIV